MGEGLEPCPSCDGERWDVWGGNPDKDCTVCNGRGSVQEEVPTSPTPTLCASKMGPIVEDDGVTERPRAARFIGWIADRFQQRHVPPLSRDAALAMAVLCLDASEDQDPFGHPDFAWDEDGAHAVADDEIESGWESAS